MKIFYRVLSKNLDEHTILVRYWTDTMSEESLTTFRDAEGKAVLGEDGAGLAVVQRRGETCLDEDVAHDGG